MYTDNINRMLRHVSLRPPHLSTRLHLRTCALDTMGGASRRVISAFVSKKITRFKFVGYSINSSSYTIQHIVLVLRGMINSTNSIPGRALLIVLLLNITTVVLHILYEKACAHVSRYNRTIKKHKHILIGPTAVSDHGHTTDIRSLLHQLCRPSLLTRLLLVHMLTSSYHSWSLAMEVIRDLAHNYVLSTTQDDKLIQKKLKYRVQRYL